MKNVFLMILFGLVTVASAFAQDKAPTVDQILEKNLQAMGGKAAFEKLTSRVSKGSFEIPAMGAGGPIEIYEKAPNKNLAVITIEGFGVVQQGFNGTVAWENEPQNGLREKSGAELADAKRNADFYGPVRLKELYPKMELKGKEKVGAGEAYVIIATPPSGAPETIYFDTQSGLVVRQDSTRETAQGKMNIQAFLEDYRVVDGVKLPFVVKQNSDAISFVIKLTEIKHNVAVEDAKFNKPAN